MKKNTPSKIICEKCGRTKNLVEHHISYIPEITQILCRSCDAREARKVKVGGTILKAYPQRGFLSVPKYILAQMGALIRFYPAPVSPVAAIFPHDMPLNEAAQGLEIVLQDIRLRMGKDESKEPIE